jgi:hypothetical protein
MNNMRDDIYYIIIIIIIIMIYLYINVLVMIFMQRFNFESLGHSPSQCDVTRESSFA